MDSMMLIEKGTAHWLHQTSDVSNRACSSVHSGLMAS